MVESIKKLREICSSRKKQPLYMELVSMKISIYITKLLLYTKISADYVTITMIVLLITGSILMAFGSLWTILTGILLIHFTVILDNVNGEVARYWKEDGLIGTFLEEVFHKLLVPLVFFSLAFGIFMGTGNKLILVFGFLSAIFGSPIILNAAKEAAVAERLSEAMEGKKAQKVQIIAKSKIKGGGTEIGRRLYRAYDFIREFWVYPANIVYINILAVIEIINLSYAFLPQYFLLSLYLMLYGSASAIIQLISFIVNYKGRTVEHYYKELFSRK